MEKAADICSVPAWNAESAGMQLQNTRKTELSEVQPRRYASDVTGRVCGQCGAHSADGYFGEACSDRARMWYCSLCWKAWEEGPWEQGQDSRRGFRGTVYHGEVYLPFIQPAAVDKLRKRAKLSSGDVVVCTYPRSGTTWVQQILLGLLLEEGPAGIKNPTKQAPWIEAALCRGNLSLDELRGERTVTQAIGNLLFSPERRVFKTHATASLAPWSDRGNARLIFVERDPRDVCVSYFHHMHDASAYHYEGEWRDFIELFLDGGVEGGDYWQWHLGWWSACEAIPESETLWLRYEDLKRDLHSQVVRIAEFVGANASEERIDTVVASATFQAMKSAMTSRNDQRMKHGVNTNPNFIRRGETGTHREMMDEADVERFQQRALQAGMELVDSMST